MVCSWHWTMYKLWTCHGWKNKTERACANVLKDQLICKNNAPSKPKLQRLVSFTNNCHVHILISDYITFWKLKDTCKEVIPIYKDTKTQNINQLRRSNTYLSMFVLIQTAFIVFTCTQDTYSPLSDTRLTVWTCVSGSQRTTSKLKVRTKKTDPWRDEW